MGQLEDILKHQNMVRNNIMKSFGVETSEDSLEKSFEDEVNPFEMEAYKSELTKAELDEFEKAKHNDGDMHPNGKWVWRASANGGKGDWRVAKPGGSKATANDFDKLLDSLDRNSDYDDVDEVAKKIAEKYVELGLNINKETVNDLVKEWAYKYGTKVHVLPTLAVKRMKPIVNEIKKKMSDTQKKSEKTDDTSKQTKQSSGDVNNLKLNGVDITVKRDPRDKYGYIVEGNGKSFKTQDPSFYNVKKPLGLVKKELADKLGIPLKITAKKKADDSEKTYVAKEADAYDKGDGKVGNYPVPTHTSYPAANLYSRLKNNRHFGFKHGLPEEEITKKLKDYKGNVKVSYHNNAGTIEIYRIEFK